MHTNTSLTSDRQRVLACGLFDADWYATTYPDVGHSGRAPVDHFLTLGTRLERDPGPQFSTRFYLHIHGHKKLAGRNALLHHLDHPHEPGVADLVLRGLHEMVAQGQSALARRLAPALIPDRGRAALASLDMAAALETGAQDEWLAALNGYLGHYGEPSLALSRPGTEIFPALAPAQAVLPVSDGPLISVLMPVYNAEATLAYAVRSILGQSWRNIELIAVDDASTDGSWPMLLRMAAADPRLRPIRLPVNAGPYVAKTLGLRQTRGAWITGHDADDWAHPHRIARHMAAMDPHHDPVSLIWGLRLTSEGRPSHISRSDTETSSDGFNRRAPIGAMFDAAFLRERLGGWDSVRFGADTEMLERAEHVLGRKIGEKPVIGMLCRDAPDSLSNDRTHGTRARNGRISDSRRAYLQMTRGWLAEQPPEASLILPFPHLPRRFPAPEPMLVAESALCRLAAQPAR